MGFLNKFATDERGASAMIWGLTLLPLFIIAGAAIDLTRHATSERHLRAATDAAAVAAVRYALTVSENESEVIAEAQRFFKENLPPQWSGFDVNPEISFVRGESVEVTAEFAMPTTMLALANIRSLRVDGLSEAVYGAAGPLEIALVLDNSYSMVGQPMADLKDAATDFVDTLVDAGDDVRIALVPFNNFVNVGTANRTQSWIDVPANYVDTGTHCAVDTAASIAAGCYHVSETCYSDGQPYACGRLECPAGVNPVETCYTYSTNIVWHGCVFARGAPLDVEDRNYATDRIRGRMDWSAWGCPRPIEPLTDNKVRLRNAIDAMTAESETMIYEGLAWGYRALTSAQPFDEGLTNADLEALNGKKILVLMSDGANSRSPDPNTPNSDHWWTNVDYSNGRTRAACAEIRNAGIEVHVIALGLTDADTLALLEDCAGDASRFHSIADSDELQATFQAIGGAIREIALSR